MKLGRDYSPRREKELKPREDNKSNTITTGATKESIIAVALRNRGKGKKPKYNGTGRANSLTTVQTDSMVQEDFIIRKLTPIECARLQCFPDDWCKDLSNTRQYKGYGNAVNVEVVKHIFNCLKESL